MIAIETLAAAIRTSTDIKGIKLDLKEWKIVQYADDLVAFLSDLTSAQNFFKLLDRFRKLSGLKINYTKTEAMWIGSCRDSPEMPLSLKWCKSVKALGVHFSYDREVSFQKNFYDKITEIKKQIHQWSWRGLSLFGKVSVIKSLLLPKLVYKLSILSPPSDFISLIQTIIYKFLWKGPDKIARRAAINSSDYGGLNITDLETSIKSLRLAWISKIFNPEPSPWKSYLRHLLKPYGGFFFFHCNYNINDYHINSTFYLEMLQWWSEFRSKFSTDSKAYDSIIWNNCNIKIDGKPICYHNYMNAGVIFINDLMYSRNNVQSFNIAKDKGLIGSNYLTWSAVRCAVPKYLRNLTVERNVLNTLELKCGNKDFDPLTSNSKNFYASLILEKAKHSRGFVKLMPDFNLSEEETRKAFVLAKSVALETFVQCFQFKLLNDILFLNTRLAKIGRVQSDLCSFCQTSPETLEHFFYRCSFSTEFWTKFEKFRLTVAREQIKLDYVNIILGILDQRSNLLNYFIILGKLYLWNCRKNKQIPLFLPFEDVVKRKYEIEKLTASQSISNLKYFQAKWSLVSNNNPFFFVKE